MKTSIKERLIQLLQSDVVKFNRYVKFSLSVNFSFKVDLRYADLSSADLSSANLSSADFNEDTGFLLSQCPSEGSFIAWKKASGLIVKLQVTEDAKRSSATTLKCRCSKAIVLDIQNTDGSSSDRLEVSSSYTSSFKYKKGETVEEPSFDEERFNECSAGIHFFISREMAVKYN